MSGFRLTGSDRILVGILVPLMLLAAVITLAFSPPSKTGSLFENPSTFFNEPYGAKAAFVVLDETGAAVERIRRPLSDGNLDELTGLAILEPTRPLLEVEFEALQAWIAAGGRLLVVPPAPAKRSDPDEGRSLAEWFQAPAPLLNGQRVELRDLAKNAPLLEGVSQLVFTGPRRLEVDAPFAESLGVRAARTLAYDSSGGLLAEGTLGEGGIVVLADPYPLTNRGLADPDSDLLLANLADWLSHGGEGWIGVDEYHHGFVAREVSPVAILRLLLSGPWALAVAQGALAAALALWAAGARFGKPRDLVRGSRRRQREFAQAAGGLLAEAHATRFLHDTLARSYRERMCKTLKLPLDVEDREFVRALRLAADVPVTWVPPHPSGASAGPLTNADVLARVSQWRQALAMLEARPARRGPPAAVAAGQAVD
ncbi:MAG: DUF4350 domain-containing protein [Pirellulales bacterium]